MKKTPAQLLRRIAMLEAQNAELQAQMSKVLSTWSDMAMEKIIAQERCKQAMLILSGADDE